MSEVETTSFLSLEERQLITRLREGDEATFMQLVKQYGPSMQRVARLWVKTQAVAEEVI